MCFDGAGYEAAGVGCSETPDVRGCCAGEFERELPEQEVEEEEKGQEHRYSRCCRGFWR